MSERCPHCGGNVIFVSEICPRCQENRFSSQTKTHSNPSRKRKPRRWNFYFGIILAAGIYFLGTEAGWVQKEAIPFAAIPKSDTLKAEEFIDYVDVRKVDLNIRSFGAKFFDNALWNIFANNPHESSFKHVTTEGWFARWPTFCNRILEKAAEQGLNKHSLEQCLNAIAPKPRDKIALLPVAAYSCKSWNTDIWIIICKWEYGDPYEDPVDKQIRYLPLGHFRAWAMRASDQKQLGFATCN